ncbi:MAG: hypothetical protein CGU28_06230 [Candidatus Dactylopiibacterium carminicum]|uniref:Alginate biosynthesis protein AlgF n=1 Tax=Candidatus Dactylopiibacterium carminicum TaxID=857335 RepID=A0A272ET34_9RHOO|nr:hypothetical protein [Candidatus Dactylopiibacterium carminicum]KAF7599169.1 hypothetical protein BGI27_09310 [Candidatus Dactylopiibacterium carminicum]PAS93259.1 MAG: hypothetical protein CGU29_08445 [Candidatus Dactylopiibacterium carminicum]PAS97106.1 MAG: hypothetical protein CGU28_06230 [Candidatus Dactylopiibacterium carminicum]PAS99183.1 MAG: hypothetical protein BSR46_09320 [Candidatus Dactylopiibacterium carminicum]
MNLRKLALSTALAMSVAGLAHAAEPLKLEFKNGDPFSAAFKALPEEASKPLLTVTGGKPAIADGALVLPGARFTIGAVPGADGKIPESTGSGRPAGVLDFSKPYKITVRIAEATTKTAGKDSFYIYVNNSTSRQADSPLGRGSQLVRVGVGELKAGDNVFTGSLGDATSFVQIRTESGAEVKIEAITIEQE